MCTVRREESLIAHGRPIPREDRLVLREIHPEHDARVVASLVINMDILAVAIGTTVYVPSEPPDTLEAISQAGHQLEKDVVLDLE
jgi:hypothetical protein